MFRRFVVLASTSADHWRVLAGCGNTDSWVEAHAADGWPAQYADAANSSYSPVAGADALRLRMDAARSRVTWPPQVALGSGSYLAVNAQTAGGCSLMVWETDNNGPPTLVHPAVSRAAASPARCSTASTTSTSASPARCCPSRRRSGSGGASR